MTEAYALWTDHPIVGESQDRLNLCHYADVLAEIVLTSNTPLTIGAFGPWGSGKTSPMRLVAERLMGRRTTTHHWACTVWFNAWQYDREGTLWRTLLLRVLEALKSGELSEEDTRQVEGWELRL